MPRAAITAAVAMMLYYALFFSLIMPHYCHYYAADIAAIFAVSMPLRHDLTLMPLFALRHAMPAAIYATMDSRHYFAILCRRYDADCRCYAAIDAAADAA